LQTTDRNAAALDSRCLVALSPTQGLLDYAKHLLVAAMPGRGARISNGSANRFSLMRGPSGWGLAAVLGNREGDRTGQSSLLVRHRSGAERRWVEAHQAAALAALTQSTPSSRRPPRKTPRIPELHTDESWLYQNETSVGRAPAGGSAGALRPRNAQAIVPQPVSQMCRERAAFPLLNSGRVSLIQICLRTPHLVDERFSKKVPQVRLGVRSFQHDDCLQ
jgi:hypothetical protein